MLRRKENKAAGAEGPSKLYVATQALQGRDHTVGLGQEHIVGSQ